MKTATRNPISSELSHTRTSFMVKLALMVAIIFVMAFSPLGYLRTPGLTITFLTVPVAVGAIILGPTAGCHLRRSFWPDQRSYGINRRLCIQRSTSADQSVRPVIYLPGSANPRRMDLRSDFPAGKEIFQKRCIHRGKPVLPAVKHSVFHEFSGSLFL